LRNIVYRFDDLVAFAQALHGADQELVLPAAERVVDGEWVLSIFEIGGDRGRATAAAARGLDRGGGNFVLVFERRDWERLVEFADASSQQFKAAIASVPPPSDSAPIPVSLDSIPPDSSVEPTSGTNHPLDRSGINRVRASLTAPANSRILLIDDDRDIREVVGAMLDAVGLKVETSVSAEEALERMRLIPPDLIVLDWNLPGMTGIELCRVMRREPRLSLLPVLFLTAHASSRDIVEAFASGADDYVVKPFRAPELGARIFGLLRRIRQVQQPST
jgi:two-component system phosphate regulon response regulator PhoB